MIKNKKTLVVSSMMLEMFSINSTANSLFDIAQNKEAVKLSNDFPKLKEIINRSIKLNNFQKQFSFENKTYQVKYTIDEQLNTFVNSTIKKYDPDYAAAVVMDADTGEILSMASHTHDINYLNQNLCLKADFPSASVFKIVTSAAAIEKAQFTPYSVIPFNGSLHTLYKRNIRDSRYYSNHLNLNDAFAKSVNVVFGRIALKNIGQTALTDYAHKFMFNVQLPSDDLIIEQSTVLKPDDDYETAEFASGYTKETKMSPVHGAIIASIIANNGKVVNTRFIKQISDQNGKALFQSKPEYSLSAISEKTAGNLKILMNRTITYGTSRKSFRNYARDPVLKGLFIGGKTGSLSGDVVKGKHDWFVGFAEDKKTGRKLALAVLTVNKKLWKVKSSQLANYFIKQYFKYN